MLSNTVKVLDTRMCGLQDLLSGLESCGELMTGMLVIRDYGAMSPCIIGGCTRDTESKKDLVFHRASDGEDDWLQDIFQVVAL